VLLLSSESTDNFEAALQIRLLNPTAEIVVRSSGRLVDLGGLLEQRLPGVAVVDPLLLCADAFTTALRPGSMPACVEVDGQTFQITEGHAQDPHLQKAVRLPPDAAAGSPVLLSPRSLNPSWGGVTPGRAQRHRPSAWLHTRARQLRTWSRSRSRLQQAAAWVLVLLVVVGVQIFARLGGWKQGVFVTLALLKGEYVDPVNVLLAGTSSMDGLSGWMIGGTLFYSLVGTLLTSALVAVILERLLRERLGEERPRLPRRGNPPILLVEGGALAQRIAERLRREKQTVVRVEPDGSQGRTDRDVLVVSRIEDAIDALEGRSVAAVGLLSSNLLANLEGAMVLQRRWPGAGVAVLAHAFGADDSLGELLGGMAVISSVDLVADAVVATAFGERVEGVLRLRGSHLLLVRYRIEEADPLCGLNTARLENGFGITCISLRRSRHSDPIALPPPELVLAAGDQLVVLATASSLRHIELGNAIPPCCRLRIRMPGPASQERRFQAQQSLARWIGCQPGDVAHLVDGAEHLSPLLDRDISALLLDDLRRQGMECVLEGPGAAPA
jgi:Trk K+ transport system NAD-binding subunit